MCHRLCNGIHLMVLAVGLARFSDAQPAMHTRVFRTAGSYPSVVSVSPSGSVLCKSGDYPWLTQLDGFNRRDISIPPEEIIYRVHQSRSGQIWSVSNQGLLLKHTDNWILYTLPEIPAFLAVPSRHLRQIALLPAEVNHVLVLFPDKLLDFDATLHQTRILKEASATKLGEFSEIQEGIGDSIWISGTYGIARLQGPARFAARTLLPRVTPQGGWEEFTLPDTNRVNGLQRVYELSPGDLTCSANCLGAENRAIVHLRNGAWSSTALPGERIRQAWRAWDDSVWGFSTISLFHVTEFGSGGSGGPIPGSGVSL